MNTLTKCTAGILCSLVTLAQCTTKPQNYIQIIIPSNYTGWVNIVFNQNEANGKVFEFDNGYTCLIGRQPKKTLVSCKNFKNKGYTMKYYYYNDGELKELSNSGPNQAIYYNSSNKYQNSTKNVPGELFETYSFYVTTKPLAADSSDLYMERNKIFKD